MKHGTKIDNAIVDLETTVDMAGSSGDGKVINPVVVTVIFRGAVLFFAHPTPTAPPEDDEPPKEEEEKEK